MAKRSTPVVSDRAKEFEIEPLLIGVLAVSTRSGEVSFRCKMEELAAILDSREFSNLLLALRTLEVRRSNRGRSEPEPKLLLVSPKLPEIRGESVGVFRQALIISATPSLINAKPSTLIYVSIFEQIADPEVIFKILNPPEVRFNSDLPKLKLRTVPTEFRIVSEPFVINESWGYNPVLEVEVPSGDRYYISPNRSLRDIFERARRTKSSTSPPTIVGNIYRVWKKSDNQQAGFDGLEIEAFSKTEQRSRNVRLAAERFPTESGSDTRTLSSERRRRTLAGRTERPSFCSRCQHTLQPFFVLCPGSDAFSTRCEYFVG